ncbi:MAG: sialate O-acetylesterase [Treponema sp.]|nr:sialate O-acetylesterase [Treponema sp.]
MFKTAAVFSDHCVLQRNKNIDVFGWCDSDVTVTVTLSKDGKVLAENTALSKAKGKESKWIVTLPALKEETGCELKVVCGEYSKTFTDVALGEVWLCGGQSNMEFELQNCKESAEALADPNDPNVRFYYTNKIGWIDDWFYKAEENTCWSKWNSDARKAWSAVGYFFGKKLAEELGCTVGLLGCNWGGTSCSAWMHESYLNTDVELNTYIEEQIEATKGKSIEEQCREYDEYIKRDAEWNKRAQEVYAVRPDIEWNAIQEIVGKNEWPGPKSCKNPYRPCGLYQTMLSRVSPYTMKGVIWYQGESDDHKPNMYAKLFTRMIDNWRTDWNDDQLPFIFVQLTVNRYKADKDFKHWCLIREAQEKVSKTVANTYMTVLMDEGAFNDIHPKQKKIVGERLEAIAMKTQYEGKASNEETFNPTLTSSVSKDGKMILTFDNATDGFITKEKPAELANLIELEKIQGNKKIDAMVDGKWTGFEVQDKDGNWYGASAEFKGNTIEVSAKGVIPVAARYNWYNYCPVTVYNKAGLPVAPFRTNRNEKLVTEHAAIQEVMTVNTK